jgi:hypothetical protein
MPRHGKRQVQIYRAIPIIAIGGLGQRERESERIVHQCENCGMIITIVLPVTKIN